MSNPVCINSCNDGKCLEWKSLPYSSEYQKNSGILLRNNFYLSISTLTGSNTNTLIGANPNA